MEGVVIRRKETNAPEVGTGAGSFLRLLAKAGGFELMRQKVTVNATIWLTPAGDDITVELFYLLSGSIEINLSGGPVVLNPGDLFYTDDLREDVLLHALQESELLYFTNTPQFDSLFGFQEDLQTLLRRIDEKDHYTWNHSRHVMKYSVSIMERMGLGGSVQMDNIAVASLFHDVGKCFMPDDVLKGQKKLEPGEFRYIMRHPVDSGRLLRPHFNERVVEIVRNHHERLDGSGYPMGLKMDQISIEAKIVAAADAFDAMTTDRGYNKVKSKEEAALELCALPDQFDGQVAKTILELVRDGTLERAIMQKEGRDTL